MLALTPGPVQRDGDLVRRMMVLSGGMAAMSGTYPSDSVPHTQAFALYNIKKPAARLSWLPVFVFFVRIKILFLNYTYVFSSFSTSRSIYTDTSPHEKHVIFMTTDYYYRMSCQYIN